MKFKFIEIHDNIGIPYRPKGDEKFCEDCGISMGKMTNKEWKEKGYVCDACAEKIDAGLSREDRRIK